MSWRYMAVMLVLSPWALRAQEAGELVRAAEAPPNAIWLEAAGITFMSTGWQEVQARKSAEGNPLRLGGVTYPHGVGTHAVSDLLLDLKGVVTRFVAMVGVDDEKRGAGSVTFTIAVDGKQVFASPVLHGGDTPLLVDLDLRGAHHMTLTVGDADGSVDSDHADWAGALLLLQPGAAERPTGIPVPEEPAPPLAHGDGPEPAIHGPRVVGATPGRPFVFLIPATGDGPLRYAVAGLPAGLKLDPATGILSGAIDRAGETTATVTVTGPRGVAVRKLKFVAGTHKLAQTPPLGWNSWNVWAGNVNDARVRAAGDAMIATGLAAKGFNYVNIDDCWEGPRDANGEITTNNKFPDMRATADYLHSRGLRFGIYSSPGPRTCAGFPGSYQHEAQDAKTWAKWGVDYVKYDWCSYEEVAGGEGLERAQRPYRVMREALDQADRDILFSYCQYGMANVWEWGAALGGNCWRTTGDITDTWGSMAGIGFGQNGHEQFAGPGHWNDPDMLVVGAVGWGNPHRSRLNKNEQITHITLWCLQSAPLLLGCDMAKLDPWTLDLLTNAEVLDVNQDSLGRPAGRTASAGTTEVWARPLFDGTLAVGLFNRGSAGTDVTANWSDLKLTGAQPVRDLWQHKDLGQQTDKVTLSVPAHGAVLLKIGVPREP